MKWRSSLFVIIFVVFLSGIYYYARYIKVVQVDKHYRELVQEGIGQIEYPVLHSKELGQGKIPFSSERTLGVYLPPAYDSGMKRYPVVYFLCGYGVKNREWIEENSLQKIFDNVFKQQRAKECIIVILDGNYALPGSFYTNSKVTGNWENYISKEVVTFIDTHYRTIPKMEARAIVGHSMGGFGALNIGMRHPETYQVIYGMSPALLQSTGGMIGALSQIVAPSIVDEIEKIKPSNRGEERFDFTALSAELQYVVGYGQSFAPDDKFPYFQLPYRLTKGGIAMNEEALKLWENGIGNWEEKIQKNLGNLNHYKDKIGIDVGKQDANTWIIVGSQYVSELLSNQKIPHAFEMYEGEHGNKVVERLQNVVIPYVDSRLLHE